MAAGAASIRIAEAIVGGVAQLMIQGTRRADVIQIDDNGTGQAGNIKVTLGNGTTYTTKRAVTKIQVLGGAGNDLVKYNLTGDLVSTRTVVASLGVGNDQFTGNITGAIKTTGTFAVEAFGEMGDDILAINQTGATLSGTFFPYLDGGAGNDTLTYKNTGDISTGATVGPGLPGGPGNDTITADYEGILNGNYMYNLTIDGGTGNDTIGNLVIAKAGSFGTIGSGTATSALVSGGRDNDLVHYLIAIDPNASVTVKANVIGGTGTDTVYRTSNVTSDATIENDTNMS